MTNPNFIKAKDGWSCGNPADGHRQRLRERFLVRESGALTDEALLELLLCYAIPQRDVQPLAKRLIRKVRQPFVPALARRGGPLFRGGNQEGYCGSVEGR